MDISPSVYEHAARFIRRNPWDVSRDPELLFQAHAAAYRFYRQTPIMPGIDIYNLEPEAYGATVEEPVEENIPAIRRHVLPNTAGLLGLPPLDPRRDGRIPMQIAVARRLHEVFPEATIRVPISGPFSIASNLVGFDTLLSECATDPETVQAALWHLAGGQAAFAQAVQEAGVDVAFFESAACPPMLSPELFRRIEFPVLKDLMARMGQIVGHPIPCIIGGNTEPIVDIMLETGTGYLVCPFETGQRAFMRKVWNRTDVRVRINADMRIVSRGTRGEIAAEADRLLDIVRDRPNVCLGTGALPYETPPENVRYLMEYAAAR